jgi:hypothetical protein
MPLQELLRDEASRFVIGVVDPIVDTVHEDDGHIDLAAAEQCAAMAAPCR